MATLAKHLIRLLALSKVSSYSILKLMFEADGFKKDDFEEIIYNSEELMEWKKLIIDLIKEQNTSLSEYYECFAFDSSGVRDTALYLRPTEDLIYHLTDYIMSADKGLTLQRTSVITGVLDSFSTPQLNIYDAAWLEKFNLFNVSLSSFDAIIGSFKTVFSIDSIAIKPVWYGLSAPNSYLGTVSAMGESSKIERVELTNLKCGVITSDGVPVFIANKSFTVNELVNAFFSTLPTCRDYIVSFDSYNGKYPVLIPPMSEGFIGHIVDESIVDTYHCKSLNRDLPYQIYKLDLKYDELISIIVYEFMSDTFNYYNYPRFVSQNDNSMALDGVSVKFDGIELEPKLANYYRWYFSTIEDFEPSISDDTPIIDVTISGNKGLVYECK